MLSFRGQQSRRHFCRKSCCSNVKLSQACQRLPSRSGRQYGGRAARVLNHTALIQVDHRCSWRQSHLHCSTECSSLVASPDFEGPLQGHVWLRGSSPLCATRARYSPRSDLFVHQAQLNRCCSPRWAEFAFSRSDPRVSSSHHPWLGRPISFRRTPTLLLCWGPSEPEFRSTRSLEIGERAVRVVGRPTGSHLIQGR
jgi:hypothetical protein